MNASKPPRPAGDAVRSLSKVRRNPHGRADRLWLRWRGRARLENAFNPRSSLADNRMPRLPRRWALRKSPLMGQVSAPSFTSGRFAELKLSGRTKARPALTARQRRAIRRLPLLRVRLAVLTDLAQPSGMTRNPMRSELGPNIFAAALVLGTMVLVMLAKYRWHLLKPRLGRWSLGTTIMRKGWP